MKDPPALFLGRGLLLLIACLAPSLSAQQSGQQPAATHAQSQGFTLRTSVNRVLVDVVVTDAHGQPVHNLAKDDFTIEEDGRPQDVLSFDVFDFDKGMDYVPPPHLPALQPDTFVNLPATPERGPLYVLFYDLVNIPQEDQIPARAQLIKFIQNKPAGARFALFVSSDGVHLVQGFTSDQQKLLTAVDPNGTGPHVPKVFLMGVNFGQGDTLAAATRLDGIAQYLTSLPGRKNIIWFASEFPLSLFPSKDDEDAYVEEAKSTINLLAKNQIAVYPVDTSALPIAETYAAPGSTGGDGITSNAHDTRSSSRFKGLGASLTEGSYMTQDQIAEMTGGRAIYSTNDLTGALQKVTENGGNYYTLSYSPSDKSLDGHFRHIKVRLKRDGDYHLAYRRGYYAVQTESGEATTPGPLEDDTIAANMIHGAPVIHQLIFGAHVAAAPAAGKKQLYTLNYSVMAHQLRAAGETTPQLEVAVAAYDADGRMLNSSVNQVVEADPHQGEHAPAQNAYRMEQQLDAPLTARFLRFAVRDLHTGKIGVMEIPLPLVAHP